MWLLNRTCIVIESSNYQMFENIFFVGGIHGVGKSTFCKSICNSLSMNYLSASDVLKWSRLSKNSAYKKVEDINLTQDLLIKGLNDIVERNKYYILDGHYCLLNSKNEIEEVPFHFFKEIIPIAFGLVIDSPNTIREKLELRDKIVYEIDLLELMQAKEIGYASELSIRFRKELYIHEIGKDYSELLVSLKKNIP